MRTNLKHGLLVGAVIFATLGIADRTRAATAAVPTAGIAVTSVVVGAAGATESAVEETRSKWNRKLLGFLSILVLAADPDPATYLSGTSVFLFPADLLSFNQLTWYGAFSDMPAGDSGPVAGPGAIQGSGFSNDVQVFMPQGPNPALNYSTNVSNGVLTVSWSANPGIDAAGASVNMFGAAFTNISGADLIVAIEPAGSPSANLYQNTAAQSLICIPPGEILPRSCGYPNEPIRFSVTPVPEPSTLLLLGSGLAAMTALRRKRLFSPA